jgi:Rieske Fe-S protein
MIAARTDPEPRFPDGRPAAEQPAWRDDFPIDVARDNYGARRDFVKLLVLTSLAFVVGQVWIGGKSLVRRLRPRALSEIRVARLAEIPVGGVISFGYPGPDDPCLLVRTADDRLLGYGQKCTHLSCAVVPDLGHDRLHCPCHEGEFDLATGRPLAGPPRRPLPLVKLDLRDGVVYAVGLEERTT